MGRLISLLKNFCVNLFVAFAGIFIHRDKKVVLFGSWMGQRYADNSRFLYEYVVTHKNELGLKNVIWVSNNENVLSYLSERGFEAYPMHSKQSVYWHLKSGIHFVCNMYAKTGKYHGDILGELSCGAKKVQLWHGVGVKACGNLVTATQRRETGLRGILKHFLFSDFLFGNALFTPGCWKNRYHLTTGPENSRVAMLDYGVKPSRIIEANYPRESDDFILTPDEEQVVNDLVSLRQNSKLILYCPTFREMTQKDSQYQNPIDDKEFVDYLKENGYIWIEKQHFASSFSLNEEDLDARYSIAPDFDINLIFQYIDLLVTDYSSASSDCIFRWKKVVSYIPDMLQYKEFERGFVSQYEDYYPGEIAYSISELKDAITLSMDDNYLTGPNFDRFKQCRSFLFADDSCNQREILNTIMKVIYH